MYPLLLNDGILNISYLFITINMVMSGDSCLLCEHAGASA